MAEESIPETGPPPQAESGVPPRRGRRSGRGRRGRGRRRKPSFAPEERAQTGGEESGPSPEAQERVEEVASDAGEPAEEAAEPAEEAEAPAGHGEPPRVEEPIREPVRQASSHEPGGRGRQAASPASIQKTIEQVNDIIRTLRETEEDMEEILETLEAYERQGGADEREIESLRRALRHLQRPREGGGHHRGHG